MENNNLAKSLMGDTPYGTINVNLRREKEDKPNLWENLLYRVADGMIGRLITPSPLNNQYSPFDRSMF